MLSRTIFELKALMDSGQLTAEDAAAASFERIRTAEPEVKAFLSLREEEALAQARAVDEKRARGEALGALAGVPVAVKDNLCMRGATTTCASKILENFRPPYDAHVIERLKDADAIIVGKTNLDEFAMGSSRENSAFGATHNPWDTLRAPGGSSGGSAAAVASGEVFAALGSDTGGSIRQPASFCSVVGLKTTYGTVSRYGLVAFGSSLDQIGPFTRDVRDAALVMNVIGGHDPRDSTSVPGDGVDYLDGLEESVRGLRIGLAAEFFGEGLNPEVEKAVRAGVDVLKGLGCEVREVSLPHSRYAVETYYIVATAEASSNLARYDGVHYGYRTRERGDIVDLYSKTRAEGFGDEVKRRIMLGTYVLSSGYYDAYYLRAQKVRQLISQDFERAFEEVDVIAGPTSPTTAFRLGEKVSDPLSMYLSDVYTISANLAAIPAVSIPCGFDAEGLPVGLQLIGQRFREPVMLRVAHTFQRETDHHRRRPAIAEGAS